LRGQAFTWEDADLPGASSRMAAGLINPVTGQNFSPSWRLAEFLPEACEFYGRVAQLLGARIWHSLPVWRLVGEAEWAKISGKLDAASPWIERVAEHELPGWRAVVMLHGGGRVATREFCESSQRFFGASRRGAAAQEVEVLCEGAAGLIAGRLGKHRCAKGEILTVHAPTWPQDRILIGGGGWLVPLGQGTFKAGSTYTWEPLDALPTAEGRARIEAILRLLGGKDFEVTAHEAGIRPIIRKSQPVIGALGDGRVVFNGLGSKGSLYAPGVAARLNGWLCGEGDLDPGLDLTCLH
jgi:hypothetical protein